MDYRLSDLLDLDSLQKMADAHYRSAGMPIGIIDAVDSSILVGAGWQEICTQYHRANNVSLQRCRQSDDYIKGRLNQGEPCAYKCKNGLWDIGIPIIVAGRHLATLFLGQFFYEGEAPDRAFFIQQAKQFGFDEPGYMSALEQVPVFSREKVQDILKYDEALAAFLADLAERSLSKIQADQTTRESERKFRAIFDQAFQFLWLLSIDGTVLEANKAAMGLVGGAEADVIGKPYWETLNASPDQKDQIQQAVQQAAGGQQVRFEIGCLAADGNLRHVDFSLKPVTDESGKALLLIPEGRDITNHKEAEERIKGQAEFLQDLIDAMPYPIFYKNREGRYLDCNRAFETFYGMSREWIAGKTVFEISSKEMAEVYFQADNELFSNPGTQIYESSFQTADGRCHDVIFHKATFAGPDGAPAGIVGTIVDITERKQAEKERQKLQDQLGLAQKMESIGRLAGGVAHDFNNMLAVILGNAEVALAKAGSENPLSKHLAEIRKAAERSADLTRQLLAFARRQTVAPRVVDLNTIIGRILSILRRLMGEHIDLVWRPGADLWKVKIDPAQIDQILMNLAANARDAIVDVGRVILETGNCIADEAYCAAQPDMKPGGYVTLVMSDNGNGMDHETLTNIFDPFFTTKQVHQGTGLGLATVYGIVRQNSGFVDVNSEPGKGTRFKIWLPRHLGDPESTLIEEKGDRITGGIETVLVVEDEPMLLDLALTVLKDLGYAVISAASPHEAIRLADAYAGQIHLLLTDVVMPEMNGRDLAKRLQSQYPNLKCLFTSGYTANIIAHHGILEGDMNFIQKPYTLEVLADKVRQALASV